VDHAIALFEFVRDSIAYDFAAPTTPDAYRASSILESGRGHCVRKAILLCALARAADIPTALVFADLRDHTLSAEIVKLMGTDTLHHHGLVAFHLGGRWVKADPTTPRKSAEKMGIRLVEFDGSGDALGHGTLNDGRRHLEYLVFHGLYEDMPFVEVMRSLAQNYSKGNSDRFKDLGLSASNDFAIAAQNYEDS
jgi:transglutaminase-like putative cysteine protease